MRADNTHHLRQAVKRRQRNTRQRAVDALTELQQQNLPISVAGLARRANVTRSWIYSQPDLLAAIHNHQPPTTTAAARTSATDESWKRRLELAHDRIHDLANEVRLLRNQLARAHGQLRQQHTAAGPDDDSDHHANQQVR
jgi:hypothetical protein